MKSISNSSVVEVVSQKNEEIDDLKKVAIGTGVAAAGTAAWAMRERKKRKAPIEAARKKKLKISKILDDPDTPIPEKLKKQAEQSKKALSAIKEYKKSKLKIKHPYKDPYAAYDQAISKSSGIDMLGSEHEGMFVKESLKDTSLKKRMTQKQKDILGMTKRPGEKLSDIRKNIMNRIIMQEQLGELGTDTYFYRKRKGSPITIAQEKLMTVDPQRTPHLATKLAEKDIPKLMTEIRKKGVYPRDFHLGNVAFNKDFKLKPIDLGHSLSTDYEKLISEPELRKIKEAKNVASKTNRRLRMKLAKQHAKKLPMILGPAMIGYSLLKGDKASAQSVVEGMMDPSGSTELSGPEEQEFMRRRHQMESERRYLKSKFLKRGQIQKGSREYEFTRGF